MKNTTDEIMKNQKESLNSGPTSEESVYVLNQEMEEKMEQYEAFAGTLLGTYFPDGKEDIVQKAFMYEHKRISPPKYYFFEEGSDVISHRFKGGDKGTFPLEVHMRQSIRFRFGESLRFHTSKVRDYRKTQHDSHSHDEDQSSLFASLPANEMGLSFSDSLLVQELESHVQELPDKLREVIELSLSGKIPKVIAEELGRSVSTVRTQIAEARVKLKARFESR